MKALILSADGFEDSELLVPYYRFKEEHIDIDVAAIGKGTITGKHGYRVAVDKTLDEVKPDQYDVLIIPGGEAPSAIRRKEAALKIVAAFFGSGKPIAAICHGPQLLISAGLLSGRRATCHESVSRELKQAGAIYENEEVVVDRNLITSRKPADLPAFVRELMRTVKSR